MSEKPRAAAFAAARRSGAVKAVVKPLSKLPPAVVNTTEQLEPLGDDVQCGDDEPEPVPVNPLHLLYQITQTRELLQQAMVAYGGMQNFMYELKNPPDAIRSLAESEKRPLAFNWTAKIDGAEYVQVNTPLAQLQPDDAMKIAGIFSDYHFDQMLAMSIQLRNDATALANLLRQSMEIANSPVPANKPVPVVEELPAVEPDPVEF